MMKKIFNAVLFAVMLILGGCDEEKVSNRIYMFSQPGCSHCEHAHAYITRYYKGYDIKEINIREGNNMAYLIRYAQKFNVPMQTLGTPFIVMHDNYIMGWGTEQQKQFNRNIKNFSKLPSKN